MSVLASPRSLVFTALLGIGLAVIVSFAAQRETPRPSPEAFQADGRAEMEVPDRVTATVRVESDEPGARFALVANDRIGEEGDEFVTPYTFEYEGRGLELAVLALDADARLHLVLNGNAVKMSTVDGSTGITRDRPGLLEISPILVRSSLGLPGKRLGAILAEAGGPYLGVQFGGELFCAQPEVWEMALNGDATGARTRCMEATRIESLDETR